MHTRIGLISDTHSFFDDKITKHFNDCDEIWHAGDIGELDVIEKLQNIAPVRAVYGNIDSKEARQLYPENEIFEIHSQKILIRHIVGHPKRYSNGIPNFLKQIKPNILICGHSHILRVIKDPIHDLLYINPGAAGQHGFHKVKTIMKFDISTQGLSNMKVIELGLRGKIE